MFRPMRRHRQQLPQQETLDILARGSSGVLAVLGDGGFPYAVPLSYVYSDGHLYFHCAASGHKLDAVQAHPKASFCVVDQDLVVPEEYTTYFRSAIAFGRVRVLTQQEELWQAIRLLADKYHPAAAPDSRDATIRREAGQMRVLALDIEHLNGKEGLELARARQAQNETHETHL